MAEVLKFIVEYLQSIFTDFAGKMAREALQLAIKLVFDHFDGDPKWNAKTRLQVQGLILEALRSVGYVGASDTNKPEVPDEA